MKVLRIGYLGVRTAEVERMTWFLRDVLGLEEAGTDRGVTFQRLPTNHLDFVEIYPPGFSDPRMIPDGCDFGVSFIVANLTEALAEVKSAGLEVVGEPVRAADAFGEPAFGDFSWFWVRAPDGRLYAITQARD